MYVDHTGTSVKTLLVTNYAELEEVIGKVRSRYMLEKRPWPCCNKGKKGERKGEMKNKKCKGEKIEN
jgi:hypothetical protein